MASVLKKLLLASAFYTATCTLVAQDPLTAFPKNYRTVFENKTVQVIRVHYGSHEKVGIHEHSLYPTVYVYLNNSGPVRFTHSEEAKPFTVDRPPSAIGNFRISPGRRERHSVENLGDTPSDFFRVEMKQIPLQSRDLPQFRGKAPADLSHNADTTDYTSDSFDIERVLCTAGTPCTLKNSPSASLIIAFTPLKLAGKTMGNGDLQWEPINASLNVSATTQEPAHLLRILFKPSAK